MAVSSSDKNWREVKRHIQGWDDNYEFQSKKSARKNKDYEFGESEIFYEDNEDFEEKPKDHEWESITYQHKEVLDYFIADFNDREKYKLVFDIINNNPEFDKKTCYRMAIECLYTELATKHLTYINDTINENKKFLEFNYEQRKVEEIKEKIEASLTVPKNCIDSHINCCETLRKIYLNDVKKLREDVISKVKREINRLDEQKKERDLALKYFLLGVIITILVSFAAPFIIDAIKKWMNI